jgi:WD40 repeat protein
MLGLSAALAGCGRPAVETPKAATSRKAPVANTIRREVPPEGGDIRISVGVLSPDNRLFLVGFDTSARIIPPQCRALELHDVKEGWKLRTFAGHEGNVRFAAFLPDGRRALSAGGKTLKLWDVDSGREVWSAGAHDYRVGGAALAPDGRSVLTWGDDANQPRPGVGLKLWRTADGQLLRAFVYNGLILRIAFCPDSRHAYVGFRGTITTKSRLVLLDTATGKEVQSLGEEEWWRMPLAFSPDGRLALSERWQGQERRQPILVLWDWSSGREVNRFVLKPGPYTVGVARAVGQVAFTPDGKRLVSAQCDGLIHVWEVASGRELYDVPLRPLRPKGTGLAALSGDGHWAVSCNGWGEVVLATPPVVTRWFRWGLMDVETAGLVRGWGDSLPPEDRLIEDPPLPPRNVPQ